MTKGLDVCAYQLRTFDGEISCRLGQRSQSGLIPGREASRVQLLRQAEPAGFNSRQGTMFRKPCATISYASGDQSRLDILMRFFTVYVLDVLSLTTIYIIPSTVLVVLCSTG